MGCLTNSAVRCRLDQGPQQLQHRVWRAIFTIVGVFAYLRQELFSDVSVWLLYRSLPVIRPFFLPKCVKSTVLWTQQCPSFAEPFAAYPVIFANNATGHQPVSVCWFVWIEEKSQLLHPSLAVSSFQYLLRSTLPWEIQCFCFVSCIEKKLWIRWVQEFSAVPSVSIRPQKEGTTSPMGALGFKISKTKRHTRWIRPIQTINSAFPCNWTEQCCY